MIFLNKIKVVIKTHDARTINKNINIKYEFITCMHKHLCKK